MTRGKLILQVIEKVSSILGYICLIIVILSQLVLGSTAKLITNRVEYLYNSHEVNEALGKYPIDTFVKYTPASFIYTNLAILYGLELIDISSMITYKLEDAESTSLNLQNSIQNREQFIEKANENTILASFIDLNKSFNEILKVDIKNKENKQDIVDFSNSATSKLQQNITELTKLAVISHIINLFGFGKLLDILFSTLFKHVINPLWLKRKAKRLAQCQ